MIGITPDGVYQGEPAMNRTAAVVVKMLLGMTVLTSFVYGADRPQRTNAKSESTAHISAIQNDIAFISVMGSRPHAERLKGFQYAVLYNARGEVVRKIEMSSDSIYSLDKMIQENRSRGPLVVRMYRH